MTAASATWAWKRDLTPLFVPRSVAIVGASERNMIASGTFNGLRDFGFAGPIYPVNPNRATVFDLPTVPSVADLAEPVDLAVILVNAAAVPDVLEQCAARGIPAALVMSTGFAESGAEGAAHARRIAQIAEANQIRLCGPGTFGLVSVRQRVSAYMSPIYGELRPGPVGVVTQSGGLVNVILSLGQERGVGYAYIASAGSEAGLTLTDYWQFYLDDEHTRVLAGVVEQFRDPAALRAVAERAAERGVPIVVLKLGRGEAAQRASAAHTGALAGSPEFHDAFFRQHGITQVDNLDEFIESVALFANASKLPRGHRVGVVSISGGDCVLSTDLAARAGVEVPPFALGTAETIQALVPEAGQTGNPVDVGLRPMWEQGLFARIMETAAADPAVDCVVARLHPTAALFRGMRQPGPVEGAPLFAVTRATQSLAPEFYAVSREIGVPILQEFEKGFRALGRAADYTRFLERRAAPAAHRRSPEPTAEVRRLLADPRGVGVLTELESKRVLAAYGIPITRETLAANADEAVAAAETLGYPVVLKGMSPQVIHKTEAGALRVGVRSAEDVRRAYAEVEAAVRAVPGAAFDGVLVQAMAPPGTEVILGLSRDAQFGPGVVFGLGGVLVEVLQESVLRLLPLDAEEARAMVEGGRTGTVLRGVRGRGPADVDALVDVLLRFSELCGDFADGLEAIDINPLVVYEAAQGMTVLDASILLRGGAGADANAIANAGHAS